MKTTRVGWEVNTCAKPGSVTFTDCQGFVVNCVGLIILHPDNTTTVVPIAELKNIFFSDVCIERLRDDRG